MEPRQTIRGIIPDHLNPHTTVRYKIIISQPLSSPITQFGDFETPEAHGGNRILLHGSQNCEHLRRMEELIRTRRYKRTNHVILDPSLPCGFYYHDIIEIFFSEEEETSFQPQSNLNTLSMAELMEITPFTHFNYISLEYWVNLEDPQVRTFDERIQPLNSEEEQQQNQQQEEEEDDEESTTSVIDLDILDASSEDDEVIRTPERRTTTQSSNLLLDESINPPTSTATPEESSFLSSILHAEDRPRTQEELDNWITQQVDWISAERRRMEEIRLQEEVQSDESESTDESESEEEPDGEEVIVISEEEPNDEEVSTDSGYPAWESIEEDLDQALGHIRQQDYTHLDETIDQLRRQQRALLLEDELQNRIPSEREVAFNQYRANWSNESDYNPFIGEGPELDNSEDEEDHQEQVGEDETDETPNPKRRRIEEPTEEQQKAEEEEYIDQDYVDSLLEQEDQSLLSHPQLEDGDIPDDEIVELFTTGSDHFGSSPSPSVRLSPETIQEVIDSLEEVDDSNTPHHPILQGVGDPFISGRQEEANDELLPIEDHIENPDFEHFSFNSPYYPRPSIGNQLYPTEELSAANQEGHSFTVDPTFLILDEIRASA